jgi:hypothetical protein
MHRRRRKRRQTFLELTRGVETMQVQLARVKQFHSIQHTEIDMITNKPIELGKVSEETKHIGPVDPDNTIMPLGDQLA